MTIGRLQDWLEANNIAYEVGKRKAYYIDNVRQHALTRQPSQVPPVVQTNKRVLSPNHKKEHSPSNKKSKANEEAFDSPARAPMPFDIQQSPMTPAKDECEEKSRSHLRGSLPGHGYAMKKGL